MTPELSRRVTLDSLGSAPRAIRIVAAPEECVKLAARFGLVDLPALDATITLVARAESVEADGRLVASVVQTCVTSGDPVAATIDEPFVLRFVDPAHIAIAEEVELGREDCDVLPYEDGAIDLGEAVAQTLGLALDPFPRAATLDDDEGERVWSAGPDTRPFSGLKGLLGGS